MAVELSNNLARSGGRSLPATVLFDYPTLDALATYLARVWRLEADATEDIGAAKPTPTKSVNAVARLSEKEAEALLLEELELSAVGRSGEHNGPALPRR